MPPDHRALMVKAIASVGNHEKWIGATFGGIKTVSNTHVGDVGQNFVEALCEAIGLPIEFPEGAKGQRLKQSPWDVRILGKKFELKTATEDVARTFQFNHIRYHRPYDAVLCVGIGPENIYFGCWSKADIATGRAGRLTSMEKGANASYKFPKRADQLHPITEFELRIRGLVDQL